MNRSIVALFGSANKGQLNKAYHCQALEELFDFFGEPPEETKGIFWGIKTLMHGHEILYFRVRDEGFSVEDYDFGLHFLEKSPIQAFKMKALFLPGVGTRSLVDSALIVCKNHKSPLLLTEIDFYDYLSDV